MTQLPLPEKTSVMLTALTSILAVGLLAGPSPMLAQGTPEPDLPISSTYYIVIDADTGEVFAERGMHERAAMASLTKVFTAIEAIELAEPDMTFTTKQSEVLGPAHTTMGFGPNESFTFDDLLYGMMLPSGNDAAIALARNLGAQPGDTDEVALERFMALTNERIRNLGLTDTNLVNPHGWGVPGHYSTVHDLAVFTMYALQFPKFVESISTPTYTTSNGAYTVVTTNRMLNMYSGIIGGKTGFDNDAGWCLIEVAQRDGSTMISVTLDGVAPDVWYEDNRILLDYAFEQKAQRLATNDPIAGVMLSYLDPNAAVIAQNARAAGSFGVSARPNEPGDSIAETNADSPTVTDDQSAASTYDHGAINGKAFAAILVTGLILFVRAVRSFVQPMRRTALG